MQILPAKNLRPEVVHYLPYPVSLILKPSITINTFFLKAFPCGKKIIPKSNFFIIYEIFLIIYRSLIFHTGIFS